MPDRSPAGCGFREPDAVPAGQRPRRVSGQGWDRGARDNPGALAPVDGRGVDPVRTRVRVLLNGAAHDESLGRAIGRLAEAAHNFNRWEPNPEALDELVDAAEVYVDAVRVFRWSLRNGE